MKKIAIAIDGPSGSGKSTISKKIAAILNIDYIDTGSMYRAFTLKLLKNNIDIYDEIKIKNILDKTDIDFRNNHIYLDGLIVDEEIRSNEVNNSVSDVSKILEVRKSLASKQKDLAQNKSVIMDGRDIGTNILKDSEYKFYLDADINERAYRRYKELKPNNENISIEDIKNSILKRDYTDINRSTSPLRKSDTAIEIDTTNLGIEDAVNKIIEIIKEKRKQNELL